MRYKTLGKSGLNVSEMALGTWGMGGVGWDNYTLDTRIDAIKAAYENGINFYDTAPAYNSGVAEQILGKALKEIGDRENIVISTKCGNDYKDGKYFRCGHREEILKQCENSLKNLQTDYIDVYLIHWPDPNVTLEEELSAVYELKEQGKILHAGVSNFSKEQILEAEKYCPIDVFQPHYSMVFRRDEELIKWAASRNIGIMAYGSLGGGILTGKIRELKAFDADDNRNRFYPFFKEPMFSEVMGLLKKMDVIAENHNAPVSQVTLNWTAAQDYISTCLVGAQTRDKILENTKAFDWQLAEDEIKLLTEAIQQF